MKTIKILGNHVLIGKLPQKTQTKGGIHLVGRYQDDEKRWMVLSVGPGRVVKKKGKPDVLIPIELKPGDYVITNMYGGNKLALEDGTGRLVVEADEIIAKWDNPHNEAR